MIMKSQIARSTTGYGDLWDQGIKLTGSWKYLDYYGGIYNGTGQDTFNYSNSGVTYVGWGKIKPFAGHQNKLGVLELGGGAEFGKIGVTNSLNINPMNVNHNQINYYSSWKYGRFGIRSEIAYGEGFGYNSSNGLSYTETATFDVKSNGWYIEPSYYLTKNYSFSQNMTSLIQIELREMIE